VSPVTVADTTEPATVVAGWAAAPMKGVTVKLVMGLPPLPGVVHETVAEAGYPGLAETLLGAPGAVADPGWKSASTQ